MGEIPFPWREKRIWCIVETKLSQLSLICIDVWGQDFVLLLDGQLINAWKVIEDLNNRFWRRV